MTTPNLLYAILLGAAAAVSAVVILLLWPRRHVAGARSVILFMAALTWWSATYALFWLGTPGPTPFFWLDVTYIGVVIVPAALLTFSLEFTGREARLTRGLILFLAIEPVVTLALLWT
ncbi:MAG TPA: histidine kinase N-terminal 7TM domain-containing protein, partial [Caldilinea sp.]|nr:histidine kinase N-terminal 7TM domain-containing protein [Caldilinea sp.]